jgi:cytochrome c oxidase assembly protein subunit 11
MSETKNTRTGVVLILISLGMVGMSYAAVPLYRIFCQITGFGGTVQQVADEQTEIFDRQIKVRFMANVNRDMPWEFAPAQALQLLKVGEHALAFYEAENLTNSEITGTATYNVSPHKAGLYFNKIDCFCFTEQTLKPGERVDMPVTYYIDPEIMNDPNLDGVNEIVLSYTFFLKEPIEEKHIAQLASDE